LIRKPRCEDGRNKFGSGSQSAAKGFHAGQKGPAGKGRPAIRGTSRTRVTKRRSPCGIEKEVVRIQREPERKES